MTKGEEFENYAKEYLLAKGLVLLEQNFRCRYGEIDLIMRDHGTICFIEVKYRSSLSFGGAAAAIAPQKQRKIISTSLYYTTQHKHSAKYALRFDALLIQGQAKGQSMQLEWIQNAFYGE